MGAMDSVSVFQKFQITTWAKKRLQTKKSDGNVRTQTCTRTELSASPFVDPAQCHLVNNVCTCDKKDRCKWKGFIKDHCIRMMCPPLPEPVNAIYIKTPKKVNKIAQRSGGALSTDGLIQTRWGSQFKKCPLGVEIPKSKVMCTLKCHDGLIVKGANKATETKAACKCDEQGNCKWMMKSNECVAPSSSGKKKKKKKGKK